MPYRQEQFINNEIYHVILRAIDNNLLFKNINDYYRGIFSIYEFNNANPVSIFRRRRAIKYMKQILKRTGVRGPSSYASDNVGGKRTSSKFFPDTRDLLVNIFAFCFMPNHIHLLIQQIKDDGITKFMRKVGTGYATYFNKKYERKGPVFQSRFRAIYIENNDQLKTVFNYIHLNPISLVEPNWKDLGIKNIKKAINCVEECKWSSCPDYIGKKNFPSVTERDFMLKVMGGEQGCKNAIADWIKHKKEIGEYVDLDF